MSTVTLGGIRGGDAFDVIQALNTGHSGSMSTIHANSAPPALSRLGKHYLRKAGIVVPRPGSHTLRHTCVQRLVDSGFSLKTIGDYVGHRTVDATKIYTKINIERLREVALGVGEEVL